MPTTPALAVVAAALSPDARVAARAARGLGFAGVQFDAFGAGLDVTTLSQTGRREFLRVLAADGQRLAGLRVDAGNKGLGPGADVDRILSQMEKVLDAAAWLGAGVVCVELGPLPEPPRVEAPRPAVTSDMAGLLFLPPTVTAPPAPAPAGPAVDPAFASSVDGAMAALAGRADRFGVVLAFRSDLASFAALARAVGAPACPWFGIDLDPVGLLRDAWDADAVFSQLGQLVRHVRARDAVAGSDRRTKPMPIGRGDTKWDVLLNNLDGAGFSGFLTVDPLELPDREAAATAAVKYLKLHGLG